MEGDSSFGQTPNHPPELLQDVARIRIYKLYKDDKCRLIEDKKLVTPSKSIFSSVMLSGCSRGAQVAACGLCSGAGSHCVVRGPWKIPETETWSEGSSVES